MVGIFLCGSLRGVARFPVNYVRGWKLVVHINVAVAEGGSILVFQTVSPIRKAVVADRHNPIAVITYVIP